MYFKRHYNDDNDVQELFKFQGFEICCMFLSPIRDITF